MDNRSAERSEGTPGLPPYPGTPRWVYAFGLIVIVPVVVFIVRHLTGGGFAGHAH
jgi:hypothetical protein